MRAVPRAPTLRVGRLTGMGPVRSSLLLLAMAACACGLWAQDPCVECHAAQELEETEEFHQRQWRNSAHAAAGVSCANCHGGNTSTFVKLRAHKGVLNSAHRDSPTNHWNLPQTCGRCHDAEYRALQQSAHFALLERRIHAAPTCRTCHGSVAAQSLGVEGGLQARCNRCHGPDADHEVVGFPGEEGQEALARGGRNLARLRSLGRQRSEVSRAILRLRDPSKRHEAADALYAINAHWDEAIEAGHAFHWGDWESALDAMESAIGELRSAMEAGSDR